MSEHASSEFLGAGWSFPVAVEGDGRVAAAAFDEKVQQSIEVILRTAKGERVMREDFGCGIHDLVFSGNNAATIAAVADNVREALLLWEPRIDLLDVRVTSAPGNDVTLLIGIEYRVRTTNNVFNVVYPFYLDGSGS